MSNVEKLLMLLKDGAWHDNAELAAIAGNRYGARKEELVERGFDIRSRPSKSGTGCDYRLMPTPKAPRSDRVKMYLRLADAEYLSHGVITPNVAAAVSDALEIFYKNHPASGMGGIGL